MNFRTALTAAALALTATFGAQAQTAQATAGYDYASKFYPHPAWLYLSAEAPHTMNEHPAVVVARRAREGAETVAQANQKFYPHPAWMYLLAEQPREMQEHPAVIVARRAQAEREAAAQQLRENAYAQR